MKATCTNCGKKFSQRDDYIEHNPEVEPVCVACVLERIETDYPEDQVRDGNDLAYAYEVTGQSTPEDDREDWEERQRYPEESDDERKGFIGWSCDYCQCQHCHCQEERAELERCPQNEMEWGFNEALAEDTERARQAEQAVMNAQYLTWEREAAASDEFFAREEEWQEAFSPFWHNLVGSENYNRFVSPILVDILRFKKRWRR